MCSLCPRSIQGEGWGGGQPFANSDALVAYSGLDPRAHDSGRSRGRRRLSKRGEPALRRQIVGADSNLTHPADRTLTRGWKPAVFVPTVDKCRSLIDATMFFMTPEVARGKLRRA